MASSSVSATATVNDIVEQLHEVHISLFDNYLKDVDGKYVARTHREKVLTIHDLAASLKNRTGFTGNVNDFIDYFDQGIAEALYQVCDGFAVNLGGIVTISPRVGGTWEHANEVNDRKKHPITFNARIGHRLARMAEAITLECDGVADVNGYIDEFLDVTTGSVNDDLTPHGIFIMSGHKLKVVGDDASVGIFFAMASDPTQYARVDGNLAENTPTKIIGSVPDLPAGTWKVKIVTQYVHGGNQLKEPREIISAGTLTVAP
jgi:hypothetical protein